VRVAHVRIWRERRCLFHVKSDNVKAGEFKAAHVSIHDEEGANAGGEELGVVSISGYRSDSELQSSFSVLLIKPQIHQGPCFYSSAEHRSASQAMPSTLGVHVETNTSRIKPPHGIPHS
jgi:hypothetical protein